jgi:hypothetical protein
VKKEFQEFKRDIDEKMRKDRDHSTRDHSATVSSPGKKRHADDMVRREREREKKKKKKKENTYRTNIQFLLVFSCL